MSFLAEYFSKGRYLNLAEEQNRQVSRPKSVDSNSSTDKNKKETIKELLETDWFTFATKNICTTMFSKGKLELVSENKEQWEKFFSDMRLYGDNVSIRRLREDIKGDMVSYGSGYLEFVFDALSPVVLDLKRIDASKLNNAKDREGKLLLDDKGKSIGYVLSLGPNADLRSKGDPVPEGYNNLIRINTGDIFLDPFRIAEFKLYSRPNGIESIGLIEPSIIQTKRRMDLETAQVNAIWIRGTAPLFALVGDPTHEPNPQMMADALDSLMDMKHSNASAFPYYMKPEALNTKVDDMVGNIYNNLLAASASTAGIPLPFVTGQGEATNRATLGTQREMFEDNIQDKIKNFDEDWNLLVMDKIAQINGYAQGKILTGNIRLESRDEFAKRIKTYYDMNAFSPKEIRMNIKNNDDLFFDDEEYEKYIKEQEKEKKEIEDKNSKDKVNINSNKVNNSKK